MKPTQKIIIFVVVLFVIVFGFYWVCWKNSKIPLEDGITSSSAGSTLSDAKVFVVVKPVTEQIINDRLSAIGTGRALATVGVTPWSSGVMDKIFVQAGMKIAVGEPIAKLDSDNEEIAVERAKVQLNDANLTLERTVKLRATNTATEVQEITARLALDNAKLALRDAELALDRRTIRSPINGIVGILPVDAGNYVTSDTTIARIDNRQHILVDIWVPERFAPLVQIGQEIQATSIARPGEYFQGHISAIDNMVDEQSRTLRVRTEIDNNADILRSGMSFSVTLHFPGDRFPAVDPLAIQWSAEGAYVWRIMNNKAERVSVSIVQRNTDSVLVDGDLKVGDAIVIQGVQNLRRGSPVETTLNNGGQVSSKTSSERLNHND